MAVDCGELSPGLALDHQPASPLPPIFISVDGIHRMPRAVLPRGVVNNGPLHSSLCPYFHLCCTKIDGNTKAKLVRLVGLTTGQARSAQTRFREALCETLSLHLAILSLLALQSLALRSRFSYA